MFSYEGDSKAHYNIKVYSSVSTLPLRLQCFSHQRLDVDVNGDRSNCIHDNIK